MMFVFQQKNRLVEILFFKTPAESLFCDKTQKRKSEKLMLFALPFLIYSTIRAVPEIFQFTALQSYYLR